MGRRILVAGAVCDGSDGDVFELCRAVNIGEALPEVDRTEFCRERGHLTEDGGGVRPHPWDESREVGHGCNRSDDSCECGVDSV